jgi:hypothetical protein
MPVGIAAQVSVVLECCPRGLGNGCERVLGNRRSSPPHTRRDRRPCRSASDRFHRWLYHQLRRHSFLQHLRSILAVDPGCCCLCHHGLSSKLRLPDNRRRMEAFHTRHRSSLELHRFGAVQMDVAGQCRKRFYGATTG